MNPFSRIFSGGKQRRVERAVDDRQSDAERRARTERLARSALDAFNRSQPARPPVAWEDLNEANRESYRAIAARVALEARDG